MRDREAFPGTIGVVEPGAATPGRGERSLAGAAGAAGPAS